MRIPRNVLNFAKENNIMDLVEGFREYVADYKAGDKEAISEYSEKTKLINERVEKAIDDISGVSKFGLADSMKRTHPNYQWAVYAVIGNLVDAILPDSVIETFQRFADVKVGGFGDSFAFDIKPNSLFTVTKAGNGKRHAFAQRLHNGQAVLLPENRMITVEEDVYRILSGKRNLAEYAIRIAQSMEEEMAYDIYSAINDTYTSLPTQFKEASFTQDSFISLVQRVKAFNGASDVSVFGTKLALSKVVPTSDYHKMENGKEYTKTGYLSTFMGTDLFEIPQKADWTSSIYAMKLDDTRLYIIPSNGKLVKVGIEGQTISYTDNMTANANLTQKQTMHKKWAVSLISGNYFGIIDIS